MAYGVCSLGTEVGGGVFFLSLGLGPAPVHEYHQTKTITETMNLELHEDASYELGHPHPRKDTRVHVRWNTSSTNPPSQETVENGHLRKSNEICRNLS